MPRLASRQRTRVSSRRTCASQGLPTVIAKNATDASDYPLESCSPTQTRSTSPMRAAVTTPTPRSPQIERYLQRGSGVDDRWVAEVGLRLDHTTVEPRLHLAGRAQPWTALHRAFVPRWDQQRAGRNGAALGAGDGRPSEPHRRGQPQRDRDDLRRNSTVSGSGDQGADPNELVKITDDLLATTPSANEHFETVIPPRNGVVVRGVSLTRELQALASLQREVAERARRVGCARSALSLGLV